MRGCKATAWLVIGGMLAGTPRVGLAQETVPVLPTMPASEAVTVAPVPVQPPAPGTAVDTVVLRDGGVVRGTVAEALPGRHVIVVSAAGQRHTFPYDQVLEVKYGVAGAPVQGQEVAPPVTVGPGRPRLHIELTREATVRLYEMSGTIMVAPNTISSGPSQMATMAARPVCMAPCDRVIDGTGGQSFFFGGDRVMPSRRFTLLDHDGDLTAVVRPGRSGVYIAGAMFTSLSLAPLLSGLIFLSLPKKSTSTDPDTLMSSPRLRSVGGALVGVGVGFLMSGIVMLAVGRTRVALYRKMTGAAQRRDRPVRTARLPGGRALEVVHAAEL